MSRIFIRIQSHYRLAMFRSMLFAGFIATVSAFSTSPASVGLLQKSSRAVASRSTARASCGLKMQEFRAQKPVDIFENMDGEGQDVKTSAFLKESEVKHGRLAMLAAVGWPVAELLHPLLTKAANLPNLLTETGQVPTVLNGGLGKLFEAPFATFFLVFLIGRVFSTETGALRPRTNFLNKDPKDMYPHDLGFDPLEIYVKMSPSERKVMAEKELNNGRLAMIAVATYTLIEFASKLPLVSIQPVYQL